ncbi:MAG: HlyD family efflux transporter periplasmic adaptor subunit [Candidatus Melainabacteria bacterium]|nr:HlyD family efflux transporter periplasmic adaptor subunit [Candidatus Melainabacteria bacterium]
MPNISKLPGGGPILYLCLATLTTVGAALLSGSSFCPGSAWFPGKVNADNPASDKIVLEKSPPQIAKITALGRLEPEGEVLVVAPAAGERQEVIETIFVHAGDEIKDGQLIARMQSHKRKTLLLAEAEKRVLVARAKLAQTRAGAKRGEVLAQEAALKRAEEERQGKLKELEKQLEELTAEVNFARIDFDRYKGLLENGAVSVAELDQRRLALERSTARLKLAQEAGRTTADTLASQIEVARQLLEKVKEVRVVDVEVQMSELKASQAALARVVAELKETEVRAPRDGQVLKVLSKAGETPGDRGLIEMGNTGAMMAVAEVYQSDLAAVNLGDQALVRAETIAAPIPAVVQHIGYKVLRQSVYAAEPGANFDARVVEVKVRLKIDEEADKPILEKLKHLTNCQVEVTITPKTSACR